MVARNLTAITVLYLAKNTRKRRPGSATFGPNDGAYRAPNTP